MKNVESNKEDGALRQVLQEWRQDAPLPPRFQENVWRRIERARLPVRNSVWHFLTHRIGTMLPQPMLAAVYVVVLLMIGISAGWSQGRQESARLKNEIGLRYVRVLDPYLTPREGGR